MKGAGERTCFFLAKEIREIWPSHHVKCSESDSEFEKITNRPLHSFLPVFVRISFYRRLLPR